MTSRVTAADGWPLRLHHYPPSGTSAQSEPVLLLHGLGGCARQFDLPVAPGVPAPSLARWLSSRGYDVWVPDLRGVGGSADPGGSGKRRWGWSVDDHLDLDVPAILGAIREATAHERVHWVGHSMGGILLLAYCARYGAPDVASGVCLSGALDYSGASSRFDLIRPLKHLGRWVGRVPSASSARLLAPFAGRFETAIEASIYYPPNLAPEAARALIRWAHHDVSGEILFQLATLFQPGGLRSLRDDVPYAEGPAQITTPLLLGVGDRDLQCVPSVVDRAFAGLASPQHALRHFGRAYGDKESYGHLDVLAGRNADTEVFPCVERWIATHRAQRAEGAA